MVAESYGHRVVWCVWLHRDDALYTDSQIGGLHTATEGVKTLRLPGRFQVPNAVTGERLPNDGRTAVASRRRAQTVLLRQHSLD